MNKKQFPILILSLLVLLISSTDLSAQKPKKIFKYQGEVVAGLGVMLSQESGTGNLHIINGVRFNPYFSAGVGIGLNLVDDNEVPFIPFFLDLKAYLPVSKKLSFMFYCDPGFTDLPNTYIVTPGFGLSWNITRSLGLNLSLFHDRYFTKAEGTLNGTDVTLKTNFGYTGLRLGLFF